MLNFCLDIFFVVSVRVVFVRQDHSHVERVAPTARQAKQHRPDEESAHLRVRRHPSGESRFQSLQSFNPRHSVQIRLPYHTHTYSRVTSRICLFRFRFVQFSQSRSVVKATQPEPEPQPAAYVNYAQYVPLWRENLNHTKHRVVKFHIRDFNKTVIHRHAEFVS